MKSILFVCHGNICRSPMAEYIMKQITNNEYHIESRATSTEEIGNDIDYRAKKVLDKNGIKYDRHYAKRITQEDYDNFDIIVCFDDYNVSKLKRMFNDNSKVIKMLDKVIDDPWYTGLFDDAYSDIYKGCLLLKDKIDS